VGDLAPNAQLSRTSGECVTLAELFKHKRTVLVFLRHFG
jgi:peroxiredoxin